MGSFPWFLIMLSVIGLQEGYYLHVLILYHDTLLNVFISFRRILVESLNDLIYNHAIYKEGHFDLFLCYTYPLYLSLLVLLLWDFSPYIAKSWKSGNPVLFLIIMEMLWDFFLFSMILAMNFLYIPLKGERSILSEEKPKYIYCLYYVEKCPLCP